MPVLGRGVTTGKHICYNPLKERHGRAVEPCRYGRERDDVGQTAYSRAAGGGCAGEGEFTWNGLSGGDDPVGNNGEGPRKVAEMFQQTGHIDVTLRLYPGGRHEILNETNRCEVYDGIAAWVKRRIS